MICILELIKSVSIPVTFFGSSIAFFIGFFKYLSERKFMRYWKEFETYHELIEKLVEPDKGKSEMRLDRQTAIVFELRNYKRYYEHTLRMLNGLKESWGKDDDYKRLLTEINLTVQFIKDKQIL